MPSDHVSQLFSRPPFFSPDTPVVPVAQKPELPADDDDPLAGGRQPFLDGNHFWLLRAFHPLPYEQKSAAQGISNLAEIPVVASAHSDERLRPDEQRTMREAIKRSGRSQRCGGAVVGQSERGVRIRRWPGSVDPWIRHLGLR